MNAPLLLLLLLLSGVLDEKASACEALGIYAAESGVAFMPYVEKAVEAVEAMSMFFVEDVRQVAYKAMGGMVEAVALAFPPAGPGQTTPQVRFLPLSVSVSVSVCLNCLSVSLSVCLSVSTACLSVCPSVCLSVCLSQLSASLSLCLPVCLPACMSAHLAIPLSVCPSVLPCLLCLL